jgi:hypothetical protein
MGNQWLNYSSDFYGIPDFIYDLAFEIVGELAYQRDDLEAERVKAFRRWWNHTLSTRPYGYGAWRVLLRGEPIAEELDEESLELIDELYQRTLALAEIDKTIAQQIIDYLRQNHTYNVKIPPLPAVDEDEEYYPDPIEVFLADKGGEGNCEYFSSAMVMLCQALGLRARLAVGYLAQEYIPESDYYLVRQRDAHSWVEIYTADRDWMPYDPTPPISVLPEDKSGFMMAGALRRLSAYLEGLQYNWAKISVTGSKNLPIFNWADRVSDWLGNLESPYRKPDESRIDRAVRTWFTHSRGESYFSFFLRWLIFFLLIVNLGIGFHELIVRLIPSYLRRRKLHNNLKTYAQGPVAFYRQMLEILQEVHLYKEPHLTPREFAFKIMNHGHDFAPVGHISEQYYQIRFGSGDLTATQKKSIDEALTRLRVFVISVKKTIARPWPWEVAE